MKKLFSVLVFIFAGNTASADIMITFALQPTLNSGANAAGMVGATMAFTITSSQATYGSTSGNASLTPDFMQLTVTDSTVPTNNGVFTLSNPENYRLLPTLNTVMFLPTTSAGAASSFTFGPNSVSVSFFGMSGTRLAVVSIGDPVNPADFNTGTVADGGFNMGGSTYATGLVTITAVVPEPGEYAACAGAIAALGALAFRRRPRPGSA